MLVLKDVELSYRGVIRLLQGVSLQVADGQIVALLGANGAGKSLTLKSISGLTRAELGDISFSGSIEYNNRRIEGESPEEIVSMGITHVLEGHKVLDDLTVHENLLVGAHMCRRRNETKKRLTLVFEDYFPELKGLQKKRAGYLSGGEQQILVIARALMAQPETILLDEISFGLAPLVIRRIFQIVKRINAERKTSILLAEQNFRAALSVADLIYVMESGTISKHCTAEELRTDKSIRQFYLGHPSSGQA